MTLFDGEPTDSPIHAIGEAMRMLLVDQQIKTVGGFMTTVSIEAENFNFCAYTRFFFDALRLQVADAPVAWSSGENIEYSVASIKPMKAGLNVTGVHFMQPRLSFLFKSPSNGLADKCFIIRDVEAVELNAYCQEMFGFDFDVHTFPVRKSHARKHASDYYDPFFKGRDTFTNSDIVACCNSLKSRSRL